MNLIEQLGGYEEAKDTQRQRALSGLLHDYDWELHSALLEYRRQHNIFEIGDKVVYVDDFMPDSVSVVSEVNDRVWLNGNNAVCIKEMIKHAENEEIKAGKRLEVNQ